MQPVLQAGEAGPAVIAEGHDFTVEHDCVHPEVLAHPGQLGEHRSDITLAAALEPDATTVHEGEGAGAVPLDLVGPGTAALGERPQHGQHRFDRGRDRIGQDGVAVAVDHPVLAVGLEEHEVPGGPSAVQHELHFRVGPLLGLVGATVPDGHGAGAVLARRDVAREGGVFNRVILGVDGQVVPPGIVRQSLGQCPGSENPVALEAEVPVQGPGMVLLDHETWGARPRGGTAAPHGLGCSGRIPLGPVGVKCLGLFVLLAPGGHATTLTQVH